MMSFEDPQNQAKKAVLIRGMNMANREARRKILGECDLKASP